MQQEDTWLGTLAEQMKNDIASGAAPKPEELTVRAFMQRFGFARRTSRHINRMRSTLRKHGLRTVPDFVGIWVNNTISIQLISEDEDDQPLEDPTVRIGELEAAHQQPASVNRDDCLSTATTTMLLNDFSQLPVMKGNRDLYGIVSWRSIGQRYALGLQPQSVRECMVPHREIGIEAPLLSALEDISGHGYVLVRGVDNSITGIVTASDVTKQFMQLTGPFLLIGEIEGHLRNLVFRKFTLEEMNQASSESGSGQKVEGAADVIPIQLDEAS